MSTIVRVYVERPSHDHPTSRYEFNLADFGGQLPAVGDLILDPASREIEAANDVVVWDVIAIYHDPGRAFDAEACLRVHARARPATSAEVDVFQNR